MILLLTFLACGDKAETTQTEVVDNPTVEQAEYPPTEDVKQVAPDSVSLEDNSEPTEKAQEESNTTDGETND